MIFNEENDLKNEYQRRGINSVLKSVIRELGQIEALIFTVTGSLHHDRLVANEPVVTEMTGNQAFELKEKIKVLLDSLEGDAGGEV